MKRHPCNVRFFGMFDRIDKWTWSNLEMIIISIHHCNEMVVISFFFVSVCFSAYFILVVSLLSLSGAKCLILHLSWLFLLPLSVYLYKLCIGIYKQLGLLGSLVSWWSLKSVPVGWFVTNFLCIFILNGEQLIERK